MIKYKLPFLLVLLLTGAIAISQTLYEYKYYYMENKVRDEYTAFFVRNDDGTGFVRVAFTDPDDKQHTVVEMKIQEHYDIDKNGNPDSSLLIVETYDPVVLFGNKKNGYDPDYFCFQQSETDGFYEPVSVLSPDEKDVLHEGVITSVKLLENKDLSKEFVHQFFATNEPFYTNLFDVVVRRPTNNPAQSAAKLHLVLVANTEDPSIGSTCVIDKDATLKTFGEIAEYMKIPFESTVIYGKNYNRQNVENAINALNPSNNDIVIFYYSGHGFSDMKDTYTFPYIDLRTKDFESIGGVNAMNVQDIYRKIKSKGARLNLVLSDCCNSDPSLTNNTSSGMASLRSSSLGWSMQNCQALFLNQRPTSILMTAAAKGELSAGNNAYGGFFTFNFRETLQKNLGLFGQFVSWEQLLKTAKTQTITKANNTMCPNINGAGFSQCKQNPVFIME
jgi:hypothetical protein